MRLSEIIKIVEEMAPPELAMKGDPIGLQVGDPEQEVSRIAVSLDATSAALRETLRCGAQMLITHHPLVFYPLNRLDLSTLTGSLVADFVRAEVSCYSLHTNWDAAPSGLNDALAAVLGLEESVPLEVTFTERLYKIVVFVPLKDADNVRQAMGDAGSGTIGNYSHCSFQTEGIGMFRPLEGSNPHIGQTGKLERVQEVRVECLASRQKLSGILEAMLKAHPYEEVAYDIFPLENKGQQYGFGRIGSLSEPVKLSQFLETVSNALGGPIIRCRGDLNRAVSRVAVCGGAGGDLIELVARSGADVYVTGEIKHHQLLQAEALGLAVVDATHEATEALGMKHFADCLSVKMRGKMDVLWLEK